MAPEPTLVSATTPSTTAPTGPELARQLFEARSVAVVGASARADSVGAVALTQLVDGGFTGPLMPVNPRYRELANTRCYASLLQLPHPVDLAILAVPDAALEEQVALAAQVGVRAVVVFGGFSAVSGSALGEPGTSTTLAERLGSLAREAGMALCGPNGMGFIDFRRRLRAVGYHEPLSRTPGPVALLSQSGSVFSAVLHNTRGLELDLAVSTGQEAGLTVADYLEYVLERESTAVVALFLETIRDAPGFASALGQALERDVPVVALKVGRTQAAQQHIRAHSGALAGDDAAFDALFEAYGVARVRSLDELMDTVELFAAGRRASSGGLAAVHDSGGERAHLADLADEVGVPFAKIGAETSSRLAARLDPGLEPSNPLDAWGSGNDFEVAYREHLVALHDDPDTAVVALAVDLTTEAAADTGFVRVAKEVHEQTVKPFLILSNLTSGIDRDDAARVRHHGVPVLEGTRTGLAAIRHLLARGEVRARRLEPATPVPERAVAASWRQRLVDDRPLREAEGLALLGDYGLPVVAHREAGTPDEALAAAEHLGWPVAVKTAVPGVDHKSDVGGVHLNVDDEHALYLAYADLAGRLGPQVLVTSMAGGSVELALGLARDPHVGLVMVVAAGGTLIEVLRDRVVTLPPVDTRRARELLDRLAMRPLLDGVRGQPPADIEAVVSAIVAVSALSEDLGDHLDAIDVNPLLVGPAGCVAVDAFVVSRFGNPPGDA